MYPLLIHMVAQYLEPISRGTMYPLLIHMLDGIGGPLVGTLSSPKDKKKKINGVLFLLYVGCTSLTWIGLLIMTMMDHACTMYVGMAVCRPYQGKK